MTMSGIKIYVFNSLAVDPHSNMPGFGIEYREKNREQIFGLGGMKKNLSPIGDGLA